MNDPADTHRFDFGRNWAAFLRRIDDSIIDRAEQSLQRALGVEHLRDKSFLDLGSGSGLFSLAAWRLGAAVTSVDLDEDSVACTAELRTRFAGGDESRWSVLPGSALDAGLLGNLGKFDVVYSWGVLHHTGQMWRGMENAIDCVAPGGRLFVAIYNDQGAASRRWLKIKKLYNSLPPVLRFLVLWPAALRLWGPTIVRDLVKLQPFRTWRDYSRERGMHPWRDVVDWVGGYPFETARPEEIFDYCRRRSLQLTYLKTCGGGRGCNEFVFGKPERASLH